MRLASAMQLDARVQARNQLWGISAGVGLLAAAALAWLTPVDHVGGTVPMAVLMLAGGATILYVVAMVLMERSDATLSAIVVSPLRRWEYLTSKVITLTGMATLEAVLMAFGCLAILSWQSGAPLSWPGFLFFAGVVGLGAMHVLAGVVIVVRYEKINEVLLPVSIVAAIFQIPALWMVGAIDHPAILAIPSAAPTLLIRAAFVPLSTWEWVYAVSGTVVFIGGLALWADRAFYRHVVQRGG